MAYASTLTTYVYDVRDFSLVTILGGNDCNVHSILWHPTNPHRVRVLRRVTEVADSLGTIDLLVLKLRRERGEESSTRWIRLVCCHLLVSIWVVR